MTNRPDNWQITYLLWASVSHGQRMEMDCNRASQTLMCVGIPCSRWFLSFTYVSVTGLEQSAYNNVSVEDLICFLSANKSNVNPDVLCSFVYQEAQS